MSTAIDARPATPNLLSYRPWRGEFGGPTRSVWAIARSSLLLLLRRRLFWGLYALSAMIVLFFFYGQYLQSWIGKQLGEDTIRLGSGLVGVTVKPSDLLEILKKALHLDGTGYTFRNFFWFEGHIVMIVLALAGAILVGNDFRFGSLPFYLSKPLNRWHYLGGKFVAVGILVNAMTTVPALVLFAQYGLIDTWDYYVDSFGLLLGILGYGTALSIFLGILLLATAVWLRRTVPLIMVWAALFVMTRVLADFLVGLLALSPRWRLIDLWNDTYLVGNWCLGMGRETLRPSSQPATWEAAIFLAGIGLLCVLYLNRRLQAVEVV
jgi:ABC-type transport system involved in multi-copper enzyme maturation permease subunit